MAQRSPARPTARIEEAIGFVGMFGVLFLGVTVFCEVTGRPALGWALVLLVCVLGVVALDRWRVAVLRRTASADGIGGRPAPGEASSVPPARGVAPDRPATRSAAVAAAADGRVHRHVGWDELARPVGSRSGSVAVRPTPSRWRRPSRRHRPPARRARVGWPTRPGTTAPSTGLVRRTDDAPPGRARGHPGDRDRHRAVEVHGVPRTAGMSTVADSTIDQVRRVADELGYVPSSAAAGLATGRQRAVGVVVPVIDRWFYVKALGGVDAELRRAGYDLVLYNLGGPGATATGRSGVRCSGTGSTPSCSCPSCSTRPSAPNSNSLDTPWSSSAGPHRASGTSASTTSSSPGSPSTTCAGSVTGTSPTSADRTRRA
ncbi:hypothetical protein P9139_16805 [Curtobacterium flaccumfaciens]|nr:hypothetical protein P9139_16805 [Curtobacterium flaccumfaciens]